MQFTNNLNKNFTNFKYNRFNPSVNEWINSVYTFDKRSFNFINNKINYKLINNYFNIKPFFKNKNTLKNKSLFYRSFLSLNRIFVSMPETKYSIQNLNIFLYIFNKEELLLLKKINKLKKLIFNKINIQSNTLLKTSYTKIINENKYLNISVNFDKNIYMAIRNNLKAKYYKIFLYKKYLAKLYFNKFIFNFNNLFYLKKILYTLYNTEININIVNMKYLYLDNNLFVDAIVRKLKNRKRNVLRVLRRALILPKIPLINNLLLINKKIFTAEKIVVNNRDNLIQFNMLKGISSIAKTLYENLKNTHVVGIRLEGKGRLTRRLTASRAVYKITYLGCLKNIYSSFQGLSSVINRGSKNSSVNYINMNSNNRNGSFGIKS
jgi:hypothetical protein